MLEKFSNERYYICFCYEMNRTIYLTHKIHKFKQLVKRKEKKKGGAKKRTWKG